MANWSDLHQDILSQILQRIKDPSDNIRCSSVCSSWRSVVKRHRSTLPHSIPGLIVPPKQTLKRNFIDFRHNSSPLDYHHHNNDHSLDVSRFDTCCGSYKGWLVLTTQDHSNSIFLHNPFLNRCRLLPTLGKKVYKAVLSSSPSNDMRCVVLVLFHTKGASICRLKDGSWKDLECEDNHSGFSDALFFNERFYVVDDYGRLYTCNLDDMIMIEIEYQPSDISKLVRYKWYLVELEGQLCRVLRKFSTDESFYYECYTKDDENKDDMCSCVSTSEFRVLRFDSSTNEWVLVSDLCKNALFLGSGNSVCLSEVDMGGKIKGNKVYFTDDRQKNAKHFGLVNPGRDMGVYDMMDRRIEPLYSDLCYALMDEPPAVWVTPLPW